MNALAARRWRLRILPPPARGAWAVPEDPEAFDVFLLMGQSNMAGYGGIHPADPWQAGDFEARPGVLVLGGQCKSRDERPRGPMRWRPAAHPLHLNQRSAGFGLGLPFAERLREEAPGKVIGLIPGAWGGAPIADLGPGSPLYGNMLRRAREAMKCGRLRGVLWHQGESDAADPSLAAGHAGRLAELMRCLRSDLDEAALPFLIGDLADFGRQRGDRRSHDRVREGLRAVATADEHAGFVESEGLSRVDAVHFGRTALVTFGHRFADAWLATRGA